MYQVYVFLTRHDVDGEFEATRFLLHIIHSSFDLDTN